MNLLHHVAMRVLGLQKTEYAYLRSLIDLNDRSLQLWGEIESGEWNDRIPSELKPTVQDLVDAECVDSIFANKLEDTEHYLKRALRVADDRGLTELGDRLRQILEAKQC